MSTILDDLHQQAVKEGLVMDTVEFGQYLDSLDRLSQMKESFHMPSLKALSETAKLEFTPDVHHITYLCGNSLGLQPKALQGRMQAVMDSWADLSLFTYSAGVLPASTSDALVNHRMAELVLGAADSEVAVANGLSVNIHLLLATFYRPVGDRRCILIEQGAFPSDYYAVESQIAWHGYKPSECIIQLTPRAGEWCLRQDDILASIEKNAHRLALIWLSGVHYVTGQLFDIASITKAGHDAGCLVGWDLAHSIGNVPLHLHKWGVDFAVWCSYKYLSGGPGCLGGLFVHEKHHHQTGDSAPGLDADLKGPRLTGWWGHRIETRFEMTSKMELARGAAAYCISNNPPLLTVALLTSLDIIESCGGMEEIRRKSIALTGFLDYLLRRSKFSVLPFQVSIVTPEASAARGSQLTLHFKSNLKVYFSQLQQRGFICDIRSGCFLRVSPCALYNSFVDVYNFAETLFHLLAAESRS